MLNYTNILNEYEDRKRLNKVNKSIRTKEESKKIESMILDFEMTCDEIVKKIQNKK